MLIPFSFLDEGPSFATDTAAGNPGNPRPSRDKFHPSVVLTKEYSFLKTFAAIQAHSSFGGIPILNSAG